MRPVTAFILAVVLSCAPAIQGCAAMLSAIEVVTANAALVEDVLNDIEHVVVQHGGMTPEVETAIRVARNSYVAVLNAAQIAKDIHDRNLQDMLQHFQVAVQAVYDLTQQFGVRPSPDVTRPSALIGALTVPTATALRLKLESGVR